MIQNTTPTQRPQARRYRSSVRSAQKARTRGRIIEAAAAEFLERGYAGATIPLIAQRAGVAVETVYRSAAGKAGLLEAAVQIALAGGGERAEVAVEERPAIARVIAEQDPRRQLAAYAATQPGVWRRVGPLLAVLETAAAADPHLTALREAQARQRLEGMRRLAALLDERGALRPGLRADRAADILWTLCAQSTYQSLVTDRGWSHADYRDWLGALLADALL